MKRKAEFTLTLIAAVWQTVLLGLLPLIPMLTAKYYAATVHPTAWLYLIHASIVIFLWIAAFAIKKDKKLWGILVLAVGVILTVYDYWSFLTNILLVIAGLMMLLRHPSEQ
ncbi:MAG: DUF4064 domain-containing protein [Sporolactobacillus sp.]